METKENMVIASRLQKIYEEQSSFEQFRKAVSKRELMKNRPRLFTLRLWSRKMLLLMILY